uniref:HD-ZIP protein N-terminal domain-containing protein n=1 Tax=Opuntia streptacantha TaxID=393608 RepID=A0A7C9CR77_OPUST
MGSNDACILTGLDLGLSFSSGKPNQNQVKEYTKSGKEKTLLLKYDHVLPRLSLGSGLLSQTRQLGEEPTGYCGQTSSMSPGSSYSNSSTVKKERVGFGGEDRASDEDEEASCPRKKLRLTKEQSAVLEDSFKQHSTLNPVRFDQLSFISLD